MKTIRGKISVFLFACLALTGALTTLYFWNLLSLENKITTIRDFDDFLEDILEMRRYEKNFTYYRDVASLDESVYYLFRIEDACDKLKGKITRVTGEQAFRKFRDDLTEYKRILHRNMTIAKEASGKLDVEGFRSKGKALVDFAQNLILKKRDRIQNKLKQIRVIPFAFLAIFAVFLVLILQFVARSILKPLSLLEKATVEASKGTFRAIPYQSKSNNEVSHLIAAFNKMAQEIETRQEQLIQSRKMASIGTFTSGIAHELNNPINNISLIVEALMEDEEELDHTERMRLYQDLMNQADRTSEIVKNLLEFSRTRHSRLEEVSLETLVDKTAELVRNEMRLNHIKFKKEVRGPIPRLKLDKGGIQQVFLNLFLNSIHAIKEGGEIRVVVGLDQGSNVVRIDVEDTGVGIPAEHLHAIFDPFFSTKKEGEGTGLGLSVSYNIIKKHGGRIEVKSKPGEGTCFSLFLPVGGPHGTV